MYLESLHLTAWRPNDIDIFVFNEDHMTIIEESWDRQILQSLKLRGKMLQWSTTGVGDCPNDYQDSSSSEDEEGSSSEGEDLHSTHSLAKQTSLKAPMWTGARLQDAVNTWSDGRKYATALMYHLVFH